MEGGRRREKQKGDDKIYIEGRGRLLMRGWEVGVVGKIQERMERWVGASMGLAGRGEDEWRWG